MSRSARETCFHSTLRGSSGICLKSPDFCLPPFNTIQLKRM